MQCLNPIQTAPLKRDLRHNLTETLQTKRQGNGTLRALAFTRSDTGWMFPSIGRTYWNLAKDR
jgi:hypothetical protein